MQIHKPQSLLTFGVVVLMATLVRGVQQDSTAGPGPSGESLRPPINELPAQRFDRSFESFAPAVEKVAPAVVRIVTALSPASAADLASGVQDPLQRYLLGQVLRGRAHRPLDAGLGSGVIVAEDGFILTNCHLLDGANEVEVTLQDS